ncbi:Amino-acid acetyltransferase, mitochondrial [Fulvia fulva]|uniref:Amino-acid acetyltransferase, mitochondrial n=1 Tax=Passalora fulva TaxID=5499 RepID=A0A9Q8P6Z7_PASFU|nr:Amino-acid acetyltransferase, mitochondrial [Fulvia fulva]KAK4629023.1 Amino-acid acetyltransferase, mitochondrial [Fulvia fulva]KAK4630399.1 Amino-acid acetyltransferase, mitochondrial [Fulvia fulva]UJO15362.1 Amino-acid acetyltransferase, mitochondrial [Fulvia fulva]WPV12796.1 Amino-acid acetyltransferase, mitochondrial [Fulvia fulva]WPV27257.1 Amino-acid acetyltransferase, mitochondrial [Fulvia fulva]
MIISTCAPGRAAGTLKIGLKQYSKQYYTTGPIPATNGKHAAQRIEDPETQRELFVNVLNANATRRDAKQYLARFKSPKKETPDVGTKLTAIQEEQNARHQRDQSRVERLGVNLGGMYAPARAIASTAQFAQHDDVQPQTTPRQELHVALTCLRSPERVDDETLDGLARTLAQLVRLDMKIVLVLDGNENGVSQPADRRAHRKHLAEQADRLCDFIDRHNPEGARAVMNALELADDGEDISVTMPNLLLDPLSRGMIPVIPSLAYTVSGQLVPVPVSDIMTGLTKHLTGRDKLSVPPRSRQPPASVDRVILLDAIGGIPSKDRGDGAHVFVNLQQEFPMIEQELAEYAAEVAGGSESFGRHTIYEQHLKNMKLTRDCLELLPSSASAVIVSPQEAASSSTRSTVPTAGIGTRRQKNPLIHNLLTNKPQVSSSLPAARFHVDESEYTSQHNATTVLRRGMPLVIIPAAPRAIGWHIPKDGVSDLNLEDDPRIDPRRLVYLIEDSFRRKLNVQHYLNRVRGRVAGLIVAGEYEGGAILTWEMPPGTNDPSRMVPYLDKFAVLQTSQGSSGVADVVFQAMVRTCFPNGVCWRSRKDNPVNKWYFERAAGSWQIPNSNWTMFWTGEGVVENDQKWNDYVGVCRDIGPSWADGKTPD